MLTIAIDPGLSGAVAFLEPAWPVGYQVEDLPFIRDLSLAWVDGALLQAMILERRQGQQTRVFVERVSSSPQQGVSSSFTFGVGFGSILGVLRAMQLPIHLVSPAKWKRELGLDRNKDASLNKARLLFPELELHLKKHEGRAEALLLGHWALTRGGG